MATSIPKSTYFFFLLANIVPLLGVFFLGWNPLSIFIVYALETIVAGLFNILKLYFVIKYTTVKDPTATGVSGWGVIPFFIFHYYFFVAVQLIIFFSFTGVLSKTDLFGKSESLWESLFKGEALYALGSFILGYSYSFLNDFFVPGEYRKITETKQFFEPYKRIFVQQFVVILGCFVFVITEMADLKWQYAFVILFVLIKSVFDYVIMKGILNFTSAKTKDTAN